ncbi:hypothetical protein ACHWQZ_G010101 [Mnemiopsis leidyi]
MSQTTPYRGARLAVGGKSYEPDSMPFQLKLCQRHPDREKDREKEREKEGRRKGRRNACGESDMTDTITVPDSATA